MATDPRFLAPSPFSRLVSAHAVSMCGDAAIAASLAGSLFFSSPTSSSREKVLLYLLVTMLPFAVVAPVLGPALDYRRSGRRVLVVTSMMGRAVLALLMARWISDAAPGGLLVYPLAFGILVLAKGYSVAKSACWCLHWWMTRTSWSRELAARARERDRHHGGRCAGVPRTRGVRTGMVVAIRVRGVRDRRNPGTEDSPGPDSTDGEASRAGTRGATPAEHPARRERDGGHARGCRLSRVLCGVLAQERLVRVGSCRGDGGRRWLCRERGGSRGATCASRGADARLVVARHRLDRVGRQPADREPGVRGVELGGGSWCGYEPARVRQPPPTRWSGRWRGPGVRAVRDAISGGVGHRRARGHRPAEREDRDAHPGRLAGGRRGALRGRAPCCTGPADAHHIPTAGRRPGAGARDGRISSAHGRASTPWARQGVGPARD